MNKSIDSHYKFVIDTAFIEHSKGVGVDFGTGVNHRYVYLENSTSKQFSMVRIKSSKGVHKLDYKRRSNEEGGWEQIEIMVNDPSETFKLVTALGARYITTINKRVWTWKNAFVTLKVVLVNNLCHVLEAKYNNQDLGRVMALLDSLGIDYSEPDNRSIVEIHMDSLKAKDAE